MKAISLKNATFINADNAEQFSVSENQEIELPDWLLKAALDGNGFKFLGDVSEAQKRFDVYQASLPGVSERIKALHKTFRTFELFSKPIPYKQKAELYNRVVGDNDSR